MTEPLTKVDSAVEGLESPIKEKTHRKSSSAPMTKDMYGTRTVMSIAVETQKTGWKINTNPDNKNIQDVEILDKPLVTPLVRAIDLQFPLGTVVAARNNMGVTIRDAMKAIHKSQKKKADDELPEPYLKGFEWPPAHPSWEDEMAKIKDETEREHTKQKQWGTLLIHLSSVPEVSSHGGGKGKKKNNQ